jgi:hypothetical protein
MSGRSRSLATNVLFITQLLVVDELPDDAIVDAQPPLGQLGDQAVQGECIFPAPLQQPVPVLPDQLLRPMAPHLARHKTTGPPMPIDPFNRRADRHLEARRRLIARQTVALHRIDYTLPKIQRIGCCHPRWPPAQPAG